MQHSHEALDRGGGFSRVKLFAPLKHRDFRLLWTGMSISLLGDGIFVIAMALQVYELSNTPTALSFVGIAMTIPWIICLLIGGVVADRFNRRKIILASDITRGLAVGAIAVLSITGMLELWHMVVLVAFYGAGQAFFGPAFDAIVPDLVPEDQLAQANSLEQLMRPIAHRAAGPAIGGFLIEFFGVGYAFAADASTFVVSAIAMLLMRSSGRARATPGKSVVGDIKIGMDYIRKRTWLWATFAIAAFTYLLFMGPVEVLLPYIVKNDLNAGGAELGLIFAIGGVASVIAAISMGQIGMPKRDITWMYIAWTIATFAVALYGVLANLWVLVLASILFNAFESVGQIIWSTAKQRHVPPHLLGRVSSLDWLISIGLVPVSMALTGPAAAAIGAQSTMIVAGIIGGLVTLAGLFLPNMRAVEGKDEPAFQTGVDISPRFASPGLIASPLGDADSPMPLARAEVSHSVHDHTADQRPVVAPGRPDEGQYLAAGVGGGALALAAAIVFRRGPLATLGIVGATVALVTLLTRRTNGHSAPRVHVPDPADREGRFLRESGADVLPPSEPRFTSGPVGDRDRI